MKFKMPEETRELCKRSKVLMTVEKRAEWIEVVELVCKEALSQKPDELPAPKPDQLPVPKPNNSPEPKPSPKPGGSPGPRPEPKPDDSHEPTPDQTPEPAERIARESPELTHAWLLVAEP